MTKSKSHKDMTIEIANKAYDLDKRGSNVTHRDPAQYRQEAHKVLSAWQQGKTSTKQ